MIEIISIHLNMIEIIKIHLKLIEMGFECFY